MLAAMLINLILYVKLIIFTDFESHLNKIYLPPTGVKHFFF